MSSPWGACSLPSGMLGIPFFGAAQSHLAQQTTQPTETPHTKKDAIAISRESVPLLKPWGKGTTARAVFWNRGWSVDGAYVCKQVQSACTSPSGIIKATTRCYQHGLTSRQSIWHLQQQRLGEVTRGLSARYSLCIANAGLDDCALYSHGLYMHMKLNGIRLSEYLS